MEVSPLSSRGGSGFYYSHAGQKAMPDSDTRELFNRLGELERKVDVLIARTPQDLDVRLSGLEKSEEDRKWLFRAIITGMMGIVAALVHLFFGSK